MFYILAIDKSKGSGDLIWWRPNNAGYTRDLQQAGRYTAEQIEGNRSYYDNEETHPVHVDIVAALGMVHLVVPNDTINQVPIGSLKKYREYRR